MDKPKSRLNFSLLKRWISKGRLEEVLKLSQNKTLVNQL